MSDKPTIEETAQFIFGLIVKSVVSAATQIEESIIKKNQSKINRVFSLLKRRKGNNGLAQVKLYLDLLIPHIVVAAVEIETNPKFNPHYAEILEFMTNEYLLIFQGAAKGINEGVVDANYFVKDAGERQVVFLSSKSYTDTNEMVNQLVDKKFNEPTPMLLISLADFLFKIRSHQYKKLWLSDLKREEQPGFIAAMPEKVYQHWSGLESGNWESLKFNLILFSSLMALSVSVSRTLSF